MNIIYFKQRGSLLPLTLLYLMGLLLLTIPLEARGSGEYSPDYQNALRSALEESLARVESGDWDRGQAKSVLSELRTRYRVDYNDFAGKIDALIDEVGENRKDSGEALREFLGLQASLIEMRNQILREQEDKSQQENTLSEQNERDRSNGPNSPEQGEGSSSTDKKK